MRKRSASDEQIAELLRTAKSSLRLSTAFLTRMDGKTQKLEVVESSVPMLFPEKVTQRQSTTLCQAVMDGRLPAVMPDLSEFPEAMKLPSAWVPRIRSFVTVPVTLSDGTVYGTFCAAGLSSDRELTERDEALMHVLAQAASLVIEPGIAEEGRRDAVLERLRPVLRARGPRIVVQPIVDLGTGVRVGSEALSRFPQEWHQAPDEVFAQAHAVGIGDELELLAIKRAIGLLPQLSGYLAINISPATLLVPRVRRYLARAPLDRLLLELSEHDQVIDYDELSAVLQPLRHAGLRLAIDDVGAGFSTLRHIVLTAPDIIKIDRTLVDGAHQDHVLTMLVESLVYFARGCGAMVVAEGIETPEDAQHLRTLGVDFGQGWFFGRAGEPAEMTASYPIPATTRPAVPTPRAAPRAVASTAAANPTAANRVPR